MRRASAVAHKTKEQQVALAPGERPYMRFRCVRCNHCVSPGMFTAKGWAVYKQTELCPDCQK